MATLGPQESFNLRNFAWVVGVLTVAGFAFADGGSLEDAADDCRDASIMVEVGEASGGALAPPDDMEDHILLNIEEEHVGHWIKVTYDADQHVVFEIFTPECEQNIEPLPHQACQKASCPPGEEHDDAYGRDLCGGNGHVGKCEGGDSERGADYIAFEPAEAGFYVLRFSIDATTYHTNNAGGGRNDPCKDCVCVNCFDTTSTSGKTTPKKGGAMRIQSCHVTCDGSIVSYGFISSDESRIT